MSDSKERLNSNIYKNIFPEDVLDLEYLESLKKNAINSYNELRVPNHGFDIHDIIVWHQWTEKQCRDVYRDVMEDIIEKCPQLVGTQTSYSATNEYRLVNNKCILYYYINGPKDAWKRTVNHQITFIGAKSATRLAGNSTYEIGFAVTYEQSGVFPIMLKSESIVPGLNQINRQVGTITIKNEDSSVTDPLVNCNVTAIWTTTGSNNDLSTERKIGEQKIGEEYVRTDEINSQTQFEYKKALAEPMLCQTVTDKNTLSDPHAIYNSRQDEYKIIGIVTAVKSKDIFTVMDEGQLDWPYLDFEDTTVLYLSDKIPGKTCHYREINNMTYVPIAIYTDHKIIINIIAGTTGAFLIPYDKDYKTETNFKRYTTEELDTVAAAIWG